MSIFDDFKNANIGGYYENVFKESDSIGIATSIIEQGHRCKAHLLKEDKTANIDGRISILLGAIEFQIVEAQVKTLPSGIDTSTAFSYSCNTKIMNVARFKVSSNPVVLFVVDISRKKLFFKLFTTDYIEKLDIGNQQSKVLYFNNNDEYSDEAFIGQVLRYTKATTTDTDCFVDCGKIRQIIRNAKRKDYIHECNTIGEVEYKPYDEYEVYRRGGVRGNLAAFRIKQDGKRAYIRNGIIEMYYYSDTGSEDPIEYDIALVHFEKGYVKITRQPSDSINITDADFGNIVLEIAKEVDKENFPVLYFHEGPVYWFEGVQMYQMRSEYIRLPWELRF